MRNEYIPEAVHFFKLQREISAQIIENVLNKMNK